MSTPERQNFESSIPSRLAHPVVISLFLVVLTVAVFWPVRHCDFVNYDDPEYFYENQHVLGGLTGGNIRWAFTSIESSNWHPVTWLSLMLDAQLFGKKSFGPHLINLLFHAANAVLLFLLLRRLTSAIWRSAFVAALFGLHPLHVESVAWVAERKDVSSTFFAMLALLSYVRYAKVNRPRNFWLTFIFFAFGLMAKPMLVTLPFVMLLLDWWPLQRISNHGFQISNLRRLFLEKIPFFALSAVSCAVTFIAQQKGGAVAALQKISMPERIENAFVSCARYLGKTIWPETLANPYPHPGHWELSLVIYSVALVIGLSAIAVLFARKFPFVPAGWFWFIGTLVPVIGLVQVGDASMADRYTYFPLVGIFIALVWSAGFMFASRRVPNSLAIICAAIILAACAFRTREQLSYWQNSGALFSHTLAVTENNYVAQNDLGTWLSAQGRLPEAMDCFRESLRIKADNPDALYNLGNVFARLGDWDQAIKNYRHALQSVPDSPDILCNLGFALAAKKQFTEAIASFESALKLDPDNADAHNNLATIFFRQGNYEEATRHFNLALEQTPDNPQLLANLGETLLRQGKTELAVRCYQRAAQLEPDNEKFRQRLQAIQQHSN